VAWAYFDTSALVKRYVNEAGRREALSLLRRHDVVTSAILPVEIRSALRRRASEGALNAARVPEILRRVARIVCCTLVAVGESRAPTLFAIHLLHWYDPQRRPTFIRIRLLREACRGCRRMTAHPS
jgi:predicted nucleic acid-binding protein